jgi:serine/threonine protein kinase
MTTGASCSSRTSPFDLESLPPGTRVGEFTIGRLLGEGGYGQIYQVVDRTTNLQYAMKVEYNNARKRGIEREIAVFRELSQSPLFPSILAIGDTRFFRYFVMELLGPSISALRKSVTIRKFSKYTWLHIAYHSLRAIEQFHLRGFLHRDIKPSNFLVRPDRRNPIVLIDFGLSRPYRDESGEHLPPNPMAGYTGTAKYASLHAHDKVDLSRRDDLISWFYSMIECATGSTPWPAGNENMKKTIAKKRRISVRRLCQGMPLEFIQIWGMINGLAFEEGPDYNGIRALIVQALGKVKGHGHRYDWEKLKKEVLSELTPVNLDMGSQLGSESIWEDDPATEDRGGGCGCAVQ